MSKECSIVQIILVQGFCPLKVEITQFPDGFRLRSLQVLHGLFFWLPCSPKSSTTAMFTMTCTLAAGSCWARVIINSFPWAL